MIECVIALDARIEHYFDLWCEIIDDEEKVCLATGYRMTDKYGQGWELNREVLPEHYRAELLIAGPEVLGDEFDPDNYEDISIHNTQPS